MANQINIQQTEINAFRNAAFDEYGHEKGMKLRVLEKSNRKGNGPTFWTLE